jgi:hypothetical protein
MNKYHGTIDELKSLVSSTGIPGEWHASMGGKHIFRTLDGGVLNWWPNGTVQFQGKPDARALLERSLYAGSSQSRLTSSPVDGSSQTNGWKFQSDGLPDKPVKNSSSGPLSLLERLKQVLSAAGLTVTQITRSECIVHTPDSDHYCSVVQRVSK